MEGSNHHSLFTSAMLFVIYTCFHLLLLLDFPRNAVSSQSIVRYLPGFDGPLPFELETGYVSVDDTNDVQLFYYFFKSENNPVEDPLLFWFAGGPGCAGITVITFEIGPILFKIAEYNGSLPSLVLNPNSWTKLSNIVILDSPVGAGFSYSRSLQGSYSSDTKSAKQAYTFIRKWLLYHSEYHSNPLYIGGHSYSGRTVPVLVQDISDGIEAGDKPLINLKGYLLGNPVTDGYTDGNSLVPFAYGMAIISYELYESAKKSCGGDYVNVDPTNVQCRKSLQDVSECTKGLYDKNILEPKCLPIDIVRDRRLFGENSSREIRSPPPDPGLECGTTYGYMLSYYWANDDRVQTALNVRKGTVQEWIRCNLYDIHYLTDVESSIGYHLNLSKRHYRSLIYSGDHDMIIPFIGTQAWMRSLNYSISDEWRPWLVNGQVAGYTRTYSNNMTYATVKGAGHIAPEYKPKECFAMFKRWLSYEPL